VVEKEVIDSQIETRGALLSWPSGRILNSLIIAKNGVAANQIGSETSKPCAITIGMDSIAKVIAEKLREEIFLRQEEQTKMKAAMETLVQESWRVKEEMMKWVQVQDQATRDMRTQQKLVAEWKEKNNPQELAQAEQGLEKLKEKIKSAEEPLGKLMDLEDQVGEKVSALQQQIGEADSIIQGLRLRIEKDLEDNRKKEIPTVKVFKEIFSGTSLEGLQARLVLNSNMQSVLIKEVLVTRKTPEGNEVSEWKMEPYPLS
jgi:predicted  nucleic acid-binding Zn-ribbon protein